MSTSKKYGQNRMPKAEAREESLAKFAERMGHEGHHVARIRESLRAHARGETVSAEEALLGFAQAAGAGAGKKRARV
jgi:hypothetical protein